LTGYLLLLNELNMCEKLVNVAIIGRFQPFHWGHLEYLLAAAELSPNLIVGITNPYAESHYVHSSNVSRSTPSSNPFTFEERQRMIEASVLRLGTRLTFRKCDFRSRDLLVASLGTVDIVAVTIYDEWGQHRKALLEEAGYRVSTLWERKYKITSGTAVRELIREGVEWQHLTPPGCADVIKAVLAQRGTI
jgi:cytidyltransferase-like protein